MPRAFILGATGQDGQFLADLLIGKNYEVLGVARSREPFKTNPLDLKRPSFKIVDITNTQVLSELISDFNPDEIYNLAGESSVSKSFKDPEKTIESNVVGLVNLLSILVNNPKLHSTKVFQASSAEMFGSSSGILNENSPFNPISPYALSKLTAHKISQFYRENFGILISCGILFNHESELRPNTFVFQKIITSAVAIKRGLSKELKLGNLEIHRDWGYSKDFVEAMWLMLQSESQDDYVIATGFKHSLREVINNVFESLGISSELENVITQDSALSRPTDVSCTWGDPTKIYNSLGWKYSTDLETLVSKMVNFQLRMNQNYPK
jgi:GDPmannose 4,6-dehydratase